MYLRASKKQLAYLAVLCDELGIINRSLYEKYTLERAAKEITRLKRRVEIRRAESQQLRMF